MPEDAPLSKSCVEEPTRWECYFSGRVQGVGFRATTRRFAQERGVVGTVRNLPDGRVQMVCEGSPAHVRSLCAALRDHFAGDIRDETCRGGDPTGEFSDFRILP